ncbi:unnamed protein product, partial [Durusdinium trenchii]
DADELRMVAPSGFLLADALMILDSKMQLLLLVPGERETKADRAATEAKRIKKMLGALRHLFRNTFLDF